MNKITPMEKIFWICLAGVILNRTGNFIADKVDIGVYLDTIGTVFIAALGGYVPGIAVGLFTNLVGTIFNPDEMYFGIVSVSVAIITAFLYQRGYYKSFQKVLWTIPFTALTTSLLGTIIEEFVYKTSLPDSFGKFLIDFHRHFLDEVPDKGLAILIAFCLLKLAPSDLRGNFLLLGKMQAPLSDEMRNELKSAESKFVRSLRTKIIFALIAVTILIAFSITLVSYITYRNSMVNDRIRIANGISSMVVNEINPSRVEEFLELGHHAEGYNETENRLRGIRASNSDIKFLYVYKIMEDGCHVVFDLDTANMEASSPGDIVEFDESFNEFLPDLFAGRPIRPVISDDTYGYLLTIYKPVYNSVGQCVCYVGVDFSMDLITDYGRSFIVKVVALFSGALIFLFVLGLMFVENNIILPVNTMAYCARNFAYNSEEAREHNVERIKSLEIKTDDEIENLYSAFVKTTSDSMHYFESFKRARIEVAVMDELAHKDALTGIKNKTAYTEVTSKLDEDISAGVAQFCIIMIDVNYLKKVNDTYGHERGNEYLINACELTCKVFGKENVYRVGGDEFVVILDGEKVSSCEDLVGNIRAAIKKFRADDSLQAWEKVSAAVGVAHYRAGVDKTADEVFKRADSDMYQNKLAMKATRKD